MSQKDFLSQFSGSNGKPDSFKEEERIPVSRNKKPFNKKVFFIILVILLLVGSALAFFLLRPTIEVKDFVGLDASEAKAWIRQNEIETKGVIFKEEYNFDYDEGIIVYQSIEQGKKVRKDIKMDFIVSLGADPDEKVKLPDIMSMSKDELQEWSKENKLTKTKIMSTYSDEVEDGQVIKYEVKGVEEDAFTRSSTLNITVSKGPQPAGVVTVPDFSGKYYTEVETWGKTNKIEVVKVESYSDKIEKEKIISQSIEAKKDIKEGDSLTVYVSLGKAVYAKKFVGEDVAELDRWASKNGVYVIKKEEYSSAYKKDYVMSQSISEGKIVEDEIEVCISLGNPTLDEDMNSMTYQDLKDWIKKVNEKGADLERQHHKEEVSDTIPVGHIISINGSTSKEFETGDDITATVSLGRNIFLKDIEGITWGSFTTYSDENTEEKIRKLCEDNDVNYVVEYSGSPTAKIGSVIKVSRDSGDVVSGTYITESETITVVVCDKRVTE